MIDVIKKWVYYSNTTLVKVKFCAEKAGDTNARNSNTTLVKVKFVEFLELDIIHTHSNTTLVKVK